MKEITETLFQQRWATAPSMRQAKDLILTLGPKRTKHPFNLNKGNLRMVTGPMTMMGHSGAAHTYAEDSDCRNE